MPVFITDEAFEAQKFNRLAFERAAQMLVARIPVFLRESEKSVLEPIEHEPQLSILLTTDDGIRAINDRWFHRPWSTNVISFAQATDVSVALQTGILGDIVISVETAAREAAQSGLSLNVRMEELLIHGLAHILGEDHENEIEAVSMREMEFKLKKILNGGYKKVADLCINVDHIATIRQARGGNEPDPVTAASLVELAGADGIVVHLREDRRHIQDRDVRLLRQTVKTSLNLEMAATEEMVSIACEIRPDVVTLVPEKRQELTTEGGLNVIAHKDAVQRAVSRLHEVGIPVSLFINPEKEQVQAAAAVQADCVEIHTGSYADASSAHRQDEEFERILEAARFAAETGLRVHAGHGLNYRNVTRIAAISFIDEFSIGHAVIARAVLVGLERAVREMLSLVKSGVPL